MESFRPPTQVPNTTSPEKANPAQRKQISETLRSVYNNMAACYLKLAKWDKVIQSCDKALAIQDQDAKTYFRRGQARWALQDFEKAEQDLFKAAKLAPQDVGIRGQLQMIREKQEELTAKSRREMQMNLQKINLNA